MDEKGLGRQLQAARVKAGLTQQALCQKAGLSYSTLTKIERGAIKAPSIFTVQGIAAALGVGLDELVGLHGTTATKRRSRSGVSFVYFDINGCLVRFYHRAFIRMAEVSGAPADVIETTFWHYNDEACRGDMTMHEFNQAIASSLGINEFSWLEYYLDGIETIEQMNDVVQWASKNYHIGLLTNIMPGFVSEMRKRHMLPDAKYDAIIDSSEVGVIKPEARIYELATERAGCAPSEIMLIDDSRTNLMAAERQGWHVLWFDEYRPEESIKRINDALVPVN